MKGEIEAILRRAIEVHSSLTSQIPAIERVTTHLAEVFSKGGTVYVMGNGGSAADSQHLAAELVGRFLMERDPLPCHALTTDASTMTSLANDLGYDMVFAKQVEAFVHAKDAVIAISTSGRSANVIEGIKAAKRCDALTIALTGGDGGELARLCDMAIIVPSTETPRIQEAHGTIIHILCYLIEETLFGATKAD